MTSTGTTSSCGSGADPRMTAARKLSTMPGHRVEEEPRAVALRNGGERVGDGRREEPEIDDQRDREADITEADLQRRQQEAGPGDQSREQHDDRQPVQRAPRRRVIVVGEERRQDHRADTPVEQGGRDVGQREYLARKVHLRDQLRVGDYRVGHAAEPGRQEAPRQQAGIGKKGVWNSFAGHAGDPPERERKDQHQRDRLQDGPGQSEHRLLVTDANAMARQRPEEVTVVEQGLQGGDWPGATTRPANDDLSCRAGAGCIRCERRRCVHVLLSCKPGARPRLRTSSS